MIIDRDGKCVSSRLSLVYIVNRNMSPVKNTYLGGWTGTAPDCAYSVGCLCTSFSVIDLFPVPNEHYLFLRDFKSGR